MSTEHVDASRDGQEKVAIKVLIMFVFCFFFMESEFSLKTPRGPIKSLRLVVVEYQKLPVRRGSRLKTMELDFPLRLEIAITRAIYIMSIFMASTGHMTIHVDSRFKFQNSSKLIKSSIWGQSVISVSPLQLDLLFMFTKYCSLALFSQ